MIETWINSRWSLRLPSHRASRPEWQTGWESERLAAMHDVIRIGDIVFDVGSEEGDLSALYAQWGGRVVLFEPNERVWPNIRAIFEANELAPHAWWLGFAGLTPRGDQQMSWDPWPQSAYGEIISDHGFCSLAERDDLPVIKLDTVAGQFGHPQVITLDTEGSELEVLRGAEKILNSVWPYSKPTVFVSIHPEFMGHNYGQQPKELHEFMESAGYVGEHLATDHEEHWMFTPR